MKGNYSIEFKTLVQDLLQREADYRPSANELALAQLPLLMRKYDEEATVADVEEDLHTAEKEQSKRQRARYLKIFKCNHKCLSCKGLRFFYMLKLWQHFESLKRNNCPLHILVVITHCKLVSNVASCS